MGLDPSGYASHKQQYRLRGSMSLTRRLKKTDDPVRRFFDDEFPNAMRFARDINRELRNVETIRPETEPEPHIYGILGHAIDYRLRYYFEVMHYKNLAAWRGAELVKPIDSGDATSGQVVGSEGQALSSILIEGFFDSLTAVLEASFNRKSRTSWRSM